MKDDTGIIFGQKFALGGCFHTPGAEEVLTAQGVTPMVLLQKHVYLDPGVLCADDVAANEQAVENGERILSAFMVGETKVYVITERDRSATTILLPDEY